MPRRTHEIFCLEGDWWNDFNRSSTVKPVLKLLAQGVGVNVPFVHRDVATREEFVVYCQRWAQRGAARYPILYLAFHGEPESLFIGDRRRRDCVIHLDDLAEILGPRLTGRIVHFGSCATLYTDRRNIQRFLRATNALAVTGFKDDVDWLDSSVFDVLLFEAMLRVRLDLKGAQKVHRIMTTEHKALVRKLAFRMEVRRAN